MGRYKLTTEIFIQRSNKKHNFKYDYSLSIFNSSQDKVKIICKTHGMFEQRAMHHLSGSGCNLCARDKLKLLYVSSLEEVLEKFKSTHGDRYDYSLVKYTNANTDVDIICCVHGVFKQSPQSHIKGSNCKLCSIDSCASKRRYTLDEFISKAKSIHGNRYVYDSVIYINNSEKISITCREHGVFKQPPNAHMAGHGCRSCGNISASRLKSKGGGFSTYSKSDYKKIANLSYDGFSMLYIAKLSGNNESFFKIGISVRGVKSRLSSTKGYKMQSFIEFKIDASTAWDIEKKYIKKLMKIKCKPDVKFGGSTECFWYIPKCVYDEAMEHSVLTNGKGDLYDDYMWQKAKPDFNGMVEL